MQPSSTKGLFPGVQLQLRCLDPFAGSLLGNPSIQLLLNGFLLWQSCGLPPARYMAHLFRIGAATNAAMTAPVSTLKAMGRWSSAVYERYLRPKARDILEAQKTMTSQLPLLAPRLHGMIVLGGFCSSLLYPRHLCLYNGSC
ncbi:hypothetical protein G5714_002872 [Xyrichtys novacula]|uniref:Uncharacterized protein n=1 Tax=Xyrichtys novacula TaxID=13765 RepID=A0AAV1FG88_XYRNO|nr:hypothetical protein G5714_002872 [Xyrichtys novacula]